MDYLDIQISHRRGRRRHQRRGAGRSGSLRRGSRAMDLLRRGRLSAPFKISVVVTRHNIAQLDAFEAMADRYGPSSGSPGCARRAGGPRLGTAAAHAGPAAPALPLAARSARRPHRRFLLPPLGAGRARSPASTCAGPGASCASSTPSATSTPAPSCMHEEFRAGSIRDPGGFASIWRSVGPVPLAAGAASAGACACCG